MCGIVGLFLKGERHGPELGAFTAAMLGTLAGRGPDSAGFAVYKTPEPGRVKLTLRGGEEGAVRAALAGMAASDVTIRRQGTHLVVTLPAEAEGPARAALEAAGMALVGAGVSMELFKEVGAPAEVARRMGLSAMAGSHAVGHTRMATESAVTTEGAHPFTTGADQCLVHNGSLSNHNALRRDLVREGLAFRTENDSEVAAAYLTWRMREGASLKEALEACLMDLDGFYTFVVATRTGFAVLRDPIACKPAVMAETEDYVAFASEYQALAGLPGAADAHVFEPAPATVYAWERAA